jgi:hypothetical protein
VGGTEEGVGGTEEEGAVDSHLSPSPSRPLSTPQAARSTPEQGSKY